MDQAEETTDQQQDDESGPKKDVLKSENIRILTHI
jgi:hypothetical protein